MLVHARDQLVLVELRGVQRQGRTELTGDVEPRREPVDRDQLAAADQARLEQVAEAERADAEDDDALARARLEHASRRLDAVRDRHRLREHGELVLQLVRHPEERRARATGTSSSAQPPNNDGARVTLSELP